MPVVEIALGAVALAEPAYHAITGLYHTCKIMRAFGRDVQILFRDMEGQYLRLYLLMQTPLGDLVEPPDTGNPGDRISSIIRRQMEELKTDFAKCDELIKTVFANSGLRIETLIEAGGSSTRSASPLRAGVSGALPADDADDTLLSPLRDQDARVNGRLSRLSNFFHRRARSAGNAPIADDISVRTPNTATSPTRSERADSPLQQNLPIEVLTNPRFEVHAISQKGEKARDLQRQTGQWMHVRWAVSHKDHFKERIAHIKDVLDTLQSCLVIAGAPRPDHLTNRYDRNVQYSSASAQGCHVRLHNALAGANTENAAFSVAVMKSLDENWEDLEDQQGLKLRTEAVAFTLQKHNKPPNDSNSTLLMIETLLRPRMATAADPEFPILESVACPAAGAANVSTDNQYEAWGALSPSAQPLDRHHVFAEVAGWRQARSLGDCIDDQSFVGQLDTEALCELCKTIMVAFLHFSEVRQLCRDPTIDDYLYFEPLDVDDSGSEEDGPYVSCGFGQSKTRRRPGRKSQPHKDPDVAVVVLGLVLWQLGARARAPFLEGLTHMTSNSRLSTPTTQWEREEQATVGASRHEHDAGAKAAPDISYVRNDHVAGSPAVRQPRSSLHLDIPTATASRTPSPISSTSQRSSTRYANSSRTVAAKDLRKAGIGHISHVVEQAGLKFAQIVEACLESNATNEVSTVTAGIQALEELRPGIALIEYAAN